MERLGVDWLVTLEASYLHGDVITGKLGWKSVTKLSPGERWGQTGPSVGRGFIVAVKLVEVGIYTSASDLAPHLFSTTRLSRCHVPI